MTKAFKYIMVLVAVAAVSLAAGYGVGMALSTTTPAVQGVTVQDRNSRPATVYQVQGGYRSDLQRTNVTSSLQPAGVVVENHDYDGYDTLQNASSIDLQ